MYFATTRFRWHDLRWPQPNVKAKKVRVKGKKKRNIRMLLRTYWSYSHLIWHKGTLRQCASQYIEHCNLDRRSGSQRSGSKLKKETLACLSETIEATVTKSYSHQNASQHIKHEDLDRRSRSKVKTATLPYFSETIVTKFGTKVLCNSALQNIYNTTTLTKGQCPRSNEEDYSETIKA